MPEEAELPPYASLPSGLTGLDVFAAVTKSGYPFQAAVADVVRVALRAVDESAQLQEEWAYVDAESKSIRAVDLFAEASLYTSPANAFGLRRVHPMLNLLVECKQGELPYILFLRPEPPGYVMDFPELAGLKTYDLRVFSRIHDDEKRSVSSFGIRDALHFHDLPFLDSPVPYSISMTKICRKGSKLELTGEDTYRSITLPLFKAADYLKRQVEPEPKHQFFQPRIIVCLAVLKAPMIGVYHYEGRQLLMALPWARSCRLEPANAASFDGPTVSSVRYYDVVHESFLSQYIAVLLRDLAIASERMVTHHQEVAAGVGYLVTSDGEEESHEQLKPLPEGFEYDSNLAVYSRISRVSEGLQLYFSPEEIAAEDGHIIHFEYRDL